MKKGFTLIELLVVVLIIGILAAVALPQYQAAVAKSRFVELQTLGTAISKSQQLYFMANGVYTEQMDDLVIGMPGKVSTDGRTITSGKVTCTLYNTTLQEFNCRYNLGGNTVPLYLESLLTRNRSCRVYGGDATGTKVCRSLSKNASVGCNAGEAYCQYPLP